MQSSSKPMNIKESAVCPLLRIKLINIVSMASQLPIVRIVTISDSR